MHGHALTPTVVALALCLCACGEQHQDRSPASLALRQCEECYGAAIKIGKELLRREKNGGLMVSREEFVGLLPRPRDQWGEPILYWLNFRQRTLLSDDESYGYQIMMYALMDLAVKSKGPDRQAGTSDDIVYSPPSQYVVDRSRDEWE